MSDDQVTVTPAAQIYTHSLKIEDTQKSERPSEKERRRIKAAAKYHRLKNDPEFKARKKSADQRYHLRIKNRLIKHQGKMVLIRKARKGVCEFCNARKGIETKQTQFHHLKYDENNLSLHTVELCASCHRKETIKQLGPDRMREIGKIVRSNLTKEACSEGGHATNLVRRWVYNRATKKLQPRRTFNFVK